MEEKWVNVLIHPSSDQAAKPNNCYLTNDITADHAEERLKVVSSSCLPTGGRTPPNCSGLHDDIGQSMTALVLHLKQSIVTLHCRREAGDQIQETIRIVEDMMRISPGIV